MKTSHDFGSFQRKQSLHIWRKFGGLTMRLNRQLMGRHGVQQRRMKDLNRFYLALPLLALCLAGACSKQRPDPKSALRTAGARTFSSFDLPTPEEKLLPAHAIKFEQADLVQVLNLYAEISGRSIIRAGNLPDLKITFSNQTPMTTVEALQALDTVIAAQGIA